MPAGWSPRPETSQAGGRSGLSVRQTPVHIGLRRLSALTFGWVMSARAVERRSGPASCCRCAKASRIETRAFRRARVASCWFIAALDSIVMKADNVTTSMTTAAMIVRERIRLKPLRGGLR